MQKKKLLLLSAIVLLMGTNSYGADIVPIEKETKTIGEGTEIIVENGDNYYRLNGGYNEKDPETKLINKGKITVKDGTGVYLYGASNRNGKNIFVNDVSGIIEVKAKEKGINTGINIGMKSNAENNGTINVTGGIGVNVAGEKGKFINNGTITSTGNGSQGINVSKDGEAINNNLIKVDGVNAIGVYVQGDSKKNTNSGTFINEKNGTIEVLGNGAKGIYVSTDVKPNISNKGSIKVSNDGTGVFFYQDSKKEASQASFENNGIIEVSGYNSKTNAISRGIYLNASGVAKNLSGGTIVVNKGALGVDVNNKDATFKNEKGANIIVNGESAKNSKDKEVPTTGILVKTGNQKTENNGYIEVNQISGEGAVGIQVNDGKATNNGDIVVNAGKYTSGMKTDGKNSTIENNGNVTIIGDGQTSNGMIAQNQGTTINNDKGIVIASGKNTSAMYAKGKGTSADKESLVENRGEIELSNNAAGIKLESNGVGKNTGTIKGSGTGVNLIGGIFVNSGEISTGDIAIQSSTTSKKENNQTVIVPTNNTVYLKNGSKVNGKIVGNIGVDVLALEGKDGEYSNLDVSSYEAISVRNGNATISDSTIGLEYNSGTKEYLNTSKSELDKLESSTTMKADNSGKLTMKNSDLIIDFKDSFTNSDATENPIIDAGELHFTGNTSFAFVSSDGRNEFDVNKALGIAKIDTTGMKLETTAVWDYTITDDGKITAKKQDYIDVVTKSELNGFVNILDDLRSSLGKDFTDVVGKAELLETEEEFTKAMAQMSGGLHGYTVDIAAINSRNLVNTMKNRALTRDYLTARPVNSWYQDVVYLNNNQRLNGLMFGNYQESGVLGVSEKQSLSNGRLGFVYGGSKGKAKFDGGESGEIKNDNIYIGLYYNHDFSEKLALNTNFSFVYGNNTVDRKVKFSDVDYSFSTTYPTYAMGIGTSAIYTIKDDAKNKASFYAGIDVNRIMQGNINEDGDKKDGQANKFAIKSVPADENSYYSITPSTGFMFQNTGYIFDKKYLIGTDLAWETELGNIKDGKRLNMQKGSDNKYTPEYKVGTMQRENVFSTSIFGQLDMTESLALNGRYTSSISDDYDADMLTLGMTYKMDTMADTPILGPILSGLENTKLSSDRWTGTFALMMESEDDSNRAYYDSMGNLMSGDYATSTKMKPKFTLSLRDKQTKWSYYFEGYYMANDFLKDTKSGEADQRATRLHGEARWSDSYSKGRYGLNIGYRNETSNKPALSAYPEPQRIERGVHQLRLTPNFSYNLGSGFRLDMKTTGVFEYNYTGVRDGQMDFLMENEHYLVYTGFMPRWQLRMGYYREDRWMDNDSNKLGWDSTLKAVTEQVGPGRYQANQLRPSATYYFGNGDSMTFALRVPLGNGAWYNELGTDKKASESYETRYTVNYNHVVVPGFNIFGELTFLDLKTKVTKENDRKVTRAYSFRPTVGFSYSF